VEILGLRGRLQISCYRFDGLRFLPASRRPGNPQVRLGSIAHALKEFPRALLRRGGMNDYYASFLGEWRHFIDSIRQGNHPECTLVDGRRALEVVLAAAQSASLGQPVNVAEAPNNIHPV
jgi:predicted dehydrogenase